MSKSRPAPGLRQIVGIDQNQRVSPRAADLIQFLEHALSGLRRLPLLNRAEGHAYGAADTLGRTFGIRQQIQEEVAVCRFHRCHLSVRRQPWIVTAPWPPLDREQDGGQSEQTENDAKLGRTPAAPGRRGGHGPVAAARTDRRIRAATCSASPVEVSISS